jgi:hypothetical protein
MGWMARISDNYPTGPWSRVLANLVLVTSPRSAEGQFQGRRARPKTSGVVSYRLARQRVVDGVVKGDRPTETVCDAQPELRRVAHNCGTLLPEPCPLCEGSDMVAVTFAFGSRLPKSGRVIADLGEARKLRNRGRPSTWYVIEVCRQCWWNHLRESFEVSG